MPTPKETMEAIFRMPKRDFQTPDPVQAEAELKELGMENFDKADFSDHISKVKEVTNKLIDVFEQTDYSTTVALDALETVLRGGVAITLGEREAELLGKHLHEFHRQAAALQVVKMLAETISKTTKGKIGTQDLLAELTKVTEGK